MNTSKIGILLLILAVGLVPCALAQTKTEALANHSAVPYPTADTPKAIDRGELSAQPGAAPISVTVALSLRNLSEAEDLMKAVATPGSPQYHQFLTSDQFVARFGPTNADVAKVISGLAKYGLTAERTTATTLNVTGMPANFERAFGVSLHSYEVAAHGNAPGYTYHAPLSHPMIPSEIAGTVSAVVGLDSRPSMHPLHVSAPQAQTHFSSPTSAKPQGGLLDPFGYLTVADFASYYNVLPLYSKGITGAGRTLGIMTLASFTPSDAYAYWAALGLKVNPNRISIVNVDGGPGAPSDASGSLETTLDVEQSGGIAPGANVIVYQAPNTNQGFVDVFAVAIEANLAESLSISWGDWEWFNNLENAPVTDPITGKTVATTQAIHELLLRAGIEGQATFAAAGDNGAYDANDGCPPPYCSLTLSVDYPASDTAITAGGGTTLPGLQQYCINSACSPPYNIYIPKERVWGWDYFIGLCAALGLTPTECGIYPVGTGGGVSISFLIPSYQYFLPGVQLSQPGQSFYYLGTFYYNLPAFFPGRNLPDVSFNADPYTGYVVYYTSSVTGFGIEPGWGGTSFVGPQLNGVTALLGQDLHSRLGFLNPVLYQLVQNGQAYGGPIPPLNVISTGDNWFYYGRNGYSPAAGTGTMDVANFARALSEPY